MNLTMKTTFGCETIHSPLKPTVVISDLRDTTIPLETIFNVAAPLEGYRKFVIESMFGNKAVIAKIDGNKFHLMPIGIWPVKGKSFLANAGILCGVAKPDGDGTCLVFWYQMPLTWCITMAMFALAIASFSLVVVSVVMFTPQIEGIFLLIGIAIGGVFVVSTLVVYGLTGAWHQSKILRQFLREQFGNSKVA